jgi:hypothetical protein
MAKIFTKTTVVDEVLTEDARYTILEDGGGAFKADMQINLSSPVSVAGTDVNAALLNPLETAVDTIDDMLVTYTTAGTSTAFTLTTPQASSLATDERWRVKFNATAGATPTLNRDAKGAKALKYYDSTGTKQSCGATTIISGMITDVVYDGTDYVLLNQLPLFVPADNSIALAKLINATAQYNLIGRSTAGAGAWEQKATSANVFSLLGCADYAAMRSALGIVINTDVQAYDAQLSSLIRQNSQSAAYTTVLTDGGKHILHPAADNNARTFTIDSNANVAYPIGTAITFVNEINTVTIAITTDTMKLAGAGTTGSRTLAANGIATALKIASTTWIISGTGLT